MRWWRWWRWWWSGLSCHLSLHYFLTELPLILMLAITMLPESHLDQPIPLGVKQLEDLLEILNLVLWEALVLSRHDVVWVFLCSCWWLRWRLPVLLTVRTGLGLGRQRPSQATFRTMWWCDVPPGHQWTAVWHQQTNIQGHFPPPSSLHPPVSQYNKDTICAVYSILYTIHTVMKCLHDVLKVFRLNLTWTATPNKHNLRHQIKIYIEIETLPSSVQSQSHLRTIRFPCRFPQS